MGVIEKVRSIGADFDMELLLCALTYFKQGGGVGSELCTVHPTLFTEDFAESNFMASSDDPDKPFKTYAGMNQALVQMHKRYIDPESAEAKAAVDLVAFADGITWQARTAPRHDAPSHGSPNGTPRDPRRPPAGQRAVY